MGTITRKHSGRANPESAETEPVAFYPQAQHKG